MKMLEGPFLVDAHVHYYDCFGVGRFFAHARANFGRAAAEAGLPEDSVGCLLLAETACDAFFEVCAERAGGEIEGWRIAETQEDCTLLVRRGEEPPMVLVAGRQIATREGLEALALGTRARFKDGQSFAGTIAAVRAGRALLVIPWGFGKWSFGRGRLVSAFLETAAPRSVFLGDNGGRPDVGAEPTLFRQARARAIPILPGSDPMPEASRAAHVARAGFILAGEIEAARPWSGLRARIGALEASPPRFGALERLVPFLTTQIWAQVAKRRREEAA